MSASPPPPASPTKASSPAPETLERSAPVPTDALPPAAESIVQATDGSPAPSSTAELVQAEVERPAQEEPVDEVKMEDVTEGVKVEVAEGEEVQAESMAVDAPAAPEAQLDSTSQQTQPAPAPATPAATTDASLTAPPPDSLPLPTVAPSDALLPPAPSASLPPATADIIIVPNAPAPHSAERYKDPNSAASQAAQAASQWNGLLLWARKARGPQWDWATGMYHVPEKSGQYYSNVTPMDMSQPVSAVPTYLLSSHSTPLYNQSGLSTPGGAGGGGSVTPSTPHGSMAEYHDSGRPRRSRR